MRSTESDPDRLPTLVRATFGFAGLLAVVLAGIVVLGVRDGLRARDDVPPPASGGPGMVAVAPGGVIDPADVPDALAVLYHGASDHPEPFSAVPCFCGCDEMLGHRHLLDCFVRPDGSGWEAHAAGCGVCLGEAAQVLALVERGTPTDEIVDAVVERWSDPYLQPEE